MNSLEPMGTRTASRGSIAAPSCVLFGGALSAAALFVASRGAPVRLVQEAGSFSYLAFMVFAMALVASAILVYVASRGSYALAALTPMSVLVPWGVMVLCMLSGAEMVADVVTGADVTALPDAALSPDAAPLSDVVVPPGLDAALRDAPSVDLGPTDAPCVGGATRCGDQCVSLRSDHEHCGACGNVCAAGERCEMGRCALTCPAGATMCQPDGGAARCVDLQRDPASCGACGTVCPAGTVCMAGVCATACAASLTACGQSCRNLQTDPQHCGACGTACPAGQACERGACVCDVTRRSCMVSGAPTCVDTASDVSTNAATMPSR